MEKVSNCCQSEMIDPMSESEMEDNFVGSNWRAASCYICKTCGKPCDAVDSLSTIKTQQFIDEIFILMKLAKMTLTEINTLNEQQRQMLSLRFYNNAKEEEELIKKQSCHE